MYPEGFVGREAYVCVCACVWLLFVIAVYDTSLEAVAHASADCVLFLSPSVIFIFFSLSHAFFSLALSVLKSVKEYSNIWFFSFYLG